MAHSNNRPLIVRIDDDIYASQSLEGRSATQRANQGVDGAVGHQVCHAASPVVLAPAIGANERDTRLGDCSLLRAAIGVAGQSRIACGLSGAVVAAIGSIAS